MGQLIYDFIILGLVLCAFVLLYGLVHSGIETDEDVKALELRIKTLETRADEFEERIKNIEGWNDLAVTWMRNQQKRTRKNTADIAKLKDTSVYLGSDDPDVPETEEVQNAEQID